MLIIRFSRIGKKKQPYFRLIINEKTKDTFGDFLENLGHYNPRTKKAVLKADRIKYWLSQGAKTSATVHNLLVKEGVIEASKVKSWKPKKKKDSSSEAPSKAKEGEQESKEKIGEDAKKAEETKEAKVDTEIKDANPATDRPQKVEESVPKESPSIETK